MIFLSAHFLPHFLSYSYLIILSVLTYDDRYAHDEEDAEGSSLHYSTNMFPKVGRQVSTDTGGLPVVGMVEPAKTPSEEVKEIKKASKPRKELTEEEKLQISSRDDFLKFFNKATKIAEKALQFNEPPEIFIDYTKGLEDKEK